jgi:hypothetical protein
MSVCLARQNTTFRFEIHYVLIICISDHYLWRKYEVCNYEKPGLGLLASGFETRALQMCYKNANHLTVMFHMLTHIMYVCWEAKFNRLLCTWSNINSGERESELHQVNNCFCFDTVFSSGNCSEYMMEWM